MNDVVPNTIDIPGYRILLKIGRGGTATVYLAEEVRFGRLVALKVLAEDLSHASNFTERFLAEGKIAAGLHHPNIVTIHNMGVAGDRYFIAMEYVEGEPLSVWIKCGVAPDFAIQTVKRIAVALGFAHAHGVIHRDIKPSNILFRENRFAVLADFGIAKVLESDSELTLAGSVMGTLSYMSPQQSNGDKIDHRSDLYSLGVVLFEMLASKPPFVGDTPVSTAIKHVTEPIPKLPQPTAHFQPIIDRILAKLPEDRFQNAEDFVEALDAITGGQGGKTGSRSTMILEQDVVQSLREQSPDSSSSVKPSPSIMTVQAPPVGERQQLIDRFSRIKRQLAAVVGLLLLVFAIGKFVDWETELDFQPRMAITGLSQQAKEHIAASRYIEPDGDNAVVAYRKILELDSDNQLALKGLAKVEKKFEQEVVDTRANEGPKQALSRIENLLHAFPESPALSQLRTSIKQELAVSALKARIATLTEKANQQESALRLTEPEGDNAYATFREILSLDADNAEAVKGIKGIVWRYQDWARSSEQAGDLPKALNLVDKGLRLTPDNAELLALRSKVRRSLDLENRISKSLAEAAQRIERGHLLEPKGENAYVTVAEVLEWNPENAKALELKSTIEGLYVDKVTEAFEHGESRHGLAMAELGSKVFKDQKDLAQRLANVAETKTTVGSGNEIDRLLDKARKALRSNRLDKPARNNAVEYAARVLSIKPGHAGARGVLQGIVGRYVVLCEEALNGGRIDQALDYQEAAERLVQSYRLADTDLQKLTARLVAKRGPVDLKKPQESAKSETLAIPIAGDGQQEREEELKQLRQQLKALQSKAEQGPKEEPKKVFLPPAF